MLLLLLLLRIVVLSSSWFLIEGINQFVEGTERKNSHRLGWSVCVCVCVRTDTYGVQGQASCYQYGKCIVNIRLLSEKKALNRQNQVNGIPECV